MLAVKRKLESLEVSSRLMRGQWLSLLEMPRSIRFVIWPRWHLMLMWV